MTNNYSNFWQYFIIILAFLAGMIFQASINRNSQNAPPSQNVSDNSAVTQNELDSLLTIPNANDEEGVKKHLDLVSRLATPTSHIDLSGCMPDPLVIAIPHQETISVKNDDKNDHTLYLGNTHSFKINGKATTEIKVDFEYGLGVYGFSCDDPSKTVGVIFVYSPQ